MLNKRINLCNCTKGNMAKSKPRSLLCFPKQTFTLDFFRLSWCYMVIPRSQLKVLSGRSTKGKKNLSLEWVGLTWRVGQSWKRSSKCYCILQLCEVRGLCIWMSVYLCLFREMFSPECCKWGKLARKVLGIKINYTT